MSQEFTLIEQYLKPLSQPLAKGEVGIGDDGAILNQTANQQWVVVTDTMVAGVHYPQQTDAFDIGWKLLAVNLSDLAAMGAEPQSYSLALTLPKVDPCWLQDFTQGLKTLADVFQMPLIGGDTTQGQQTVLTLSALGTVPTGLGILRKTAQIGDLILVSGELGSGGLGLEWVLSHQQLDSEEVLKLNRPQPRIILAQVLRQADLVHSMIDISDGLVADLTHICEASNCGALIELSQLPMSKAVKQRVQQQGYQLPLTAGDDYELCLTIAPENLSAVQAIAQSLDETLTVIGRIIELPTSKDTQKQGGVDKKTEKIWLIEEPNARTPKAASQYLSKTGFQHF